MHTFNDLIRIRAKKHVLYTYTHVNQIIVKLNHNKDISVLIKQIYKEAKNHNSKLRSYIKDHYRC